MRLQIKNHYYDFFIKSILTFMSLPFVAAGGFMLALAKIGGSAWDYDGLFGYYVLGMLGGYIFYFLGILISLILIAIFNKKYMSGENIKFWPKTGLVLLAVISNWVILFVLGELFF